jgi:tol-pal system protein YbgF
MEMGSSASSFIAVLTEMHLSSPSLLRRSGRTLALAAVIAAGLAVPAFADPGAPVMLVAQNDQNAAQLVLRIQQLEGQVRDLTGQVQGLQFQLTQLQTLIDRNSQDADFRFKQLEGGKGGAPGKTDAGDQSGSVTPSEIAPQSPGRNTRNSGLGAPPANLAAPGGGDQGGDVATSDAGSDQAGGDDLGPSSDPLVGKGRAGASPGADEVPLGPSRGPGVASNPARQNAAPVTLASTGNQASAGNPAAQAQYKAGYQAIVKGDYPAATTEFKTFIKQYPDDPQAADATNYLGEALLQQQNFVDAADVLVTGYKSYPNSPRAPDMLLKLGIALGGAQQQDAACKTFGLLSTKYPNTTTAFKSRLRQEMAKGKCPA